MSRARNTLVAVAAVAMLASACSLLNRPAGSASSPGVPDPATSILVSVPSDTVYMVDPDTGAVAPVADDLTDFQSGYASWAPNHQRIAYGQAGIQLVAPGSSDVSTPVKGQLVSMPSWSANGKQIVYGNGIGMFIKTLGEAKPSHVQLPQTLAPFSFDWGHGNAIVFEGLALTCVGTPTCMSTNDTDVYTIRSDGAGLHRLTHLRTATSPKWSADYSRILFVRATGEKRTQKYQLWTVRSNGGGLVQLTDADNVVAADWSPDGKELAVVRTVGAAAGNPQLQVWVGKADGTGMHMVVDGISGADASVDW